MKWTLLFVIVALCFGCSDSVENQKLSKIEKSTTKALLKELSDEDYPDNPDVMVRHSKYTSSIMESIEFTENGNAFDLIIAPSRKEDDTVVLHGLNLMEFMPTIPENAKGDDYLSLIAVVNQEWNRNQVKWAGDDLFEITADRFVVNGESITRIDIARNCLRSYLWELFFYAEEDGKDKVFYHGWFDFPEQLYAELFKKRNGVDFNTYSKYLEEWVDPPSKKLNLYKIRNVIRSSDVTARTKNRSDEMYPMTGERKKKNIEIIYPVQYSKMSDLQTDSAQFATFSDPGFYNRKDPRKTELGRFKNLEKVEYAAIEGQDEILDEFTFTFSRENGEITQFVFGGVNIAHLPRLTIEEANSGQQYSMGIGNHPFYEDVQSHEAMSSKTSQYYGVLLDKDGKWLDSHAIGIDGPLLHLSPSGDRIHVWLLSFERHALVGHYSISLVD
jgi:hypothetical protein